MPRPKKEETKKTKTTKSKKTTVRKTRSKTTVKNSKVIAERVAKVIEKRKNTFIPMVEYEYNLRIAVLFGVLVGVIITTYLWVLINFVYL